MSKMNYIYQGFAKKESYDVLADIHFSGKKRKPSKTQRHNFIQKMAHESMESYVPNPILGQNPKARISRHAKGAMSSPLQWEKSQWDLVGRGDVFKEEEARKRIGAAITHLTNQVMKYAYDLKFSRKPDDQTRRWEPSELSDFEHVQKSQYNKMSEDQIKQHQYHVHAHHYGRYLIATYILISLRPWFEMDRLKFYKFLAYSGFGNIPTQYFTKPKVIRYVIRAAAGGFLMNFKTFNLYNGFKTDWLIKLMKTLVPGFKKEQL